MAAVKDLIIDIQDDIISGILSFSVIAEKHKVPMNWVNMAWDLLCEQENDQGAKIADFYEDMRGRYGPRGI